MDVWILPGIWGPTSPNQSKVLKILKQREIPIAKKSFWKDIWTLPGIDGRNDPNFEKENAGIHGRPNRSKGAY